MQSQSPYSFFRIDLLNSWFVNLWVNDYKTQDQKTNDLSENYTKAVNGEYMHQFVTGTKWLIDVDNLFLCRHINGNHWVALYIDLPKEVIYVYDS